MVSKSKTKQKQTVGEDQALLNLARKQGMNTEVRRSIFVVLMTSEVCPTCPTTCPTVIDQFQDYVHACDRLNALRLTSVQQREFVRVALHCCGMVRDQFLSGIFADWVVTGEAIQPLLHTLSQSSLCQFVRSSIYSAIRTMGFPKGPGRERFQQRNAPANR